MTRIKVRHFGPVQEGCRESGGWLDIQKVTLFMGNQGSGKSTVAKLISTFAWIEKALTRGDNSAEWFEQGRRFKEEYLSYHRIENYLKPHTELEYEGEAYRIRYSAGQLTIHKLGSYHLPQIMYVPSERNFIANIKTARALQVVSDALLEFLTEYGKATEKMTEPMPLPINKAEVEHNKANDTMYVKGADYSIKLTEASSGFQSLIPLYLVSWFLADSVRHNNGESMTSEMQERFRKQLRIINESADLTEEQRRIAISEEARKFNKTAFINIVEEPEQNLFPSSQWEMLKKLVEFNNQKEGNKLIATTHSPYLVNYLSLLIKADQLRASLGSDKDSRIYADELEKIVPAASTVSADKVAIYQFDELGGSISLLSNYKGLPSDDNLLNEKLDEGNELFARMLELQQKMR